MKKTLTLILGFLFVVAVSKAQSFSDDFESYVADSALGTQSTNWTTWNLADNPLTDVNVTTTDNHTASGSKSIYFSSTLDKGGPADVVLPFGGVHSSGIFTFSAWFKVPTGKTAYFNFQGNSTISSTSSSNLYSLDCYMNANGTIDFKNSADTKLTSTYPANTWFELKIVANLSTNNWEVFIAGASKGSFASTANKVSFIDIFPADSTASFWVDDVHYNVAPYTLPSVNGAVNSVSVTSGLVGQARIPAVLVRNTGTTAITSFDLAFNNNGTITTQNITGVNIPSLGTYQTSFSTLTLIAGLNTFSATISNVNGAADTITSDNTKTITFTATQPAAGKMVAVEEGTGTWCGWCPRGAVAMEMMDNKYPGYFVGIAVHNGDPMVVAPYASGVAKKVSGYPSALVDRLTSIDPGKMEPDFLTRITVAPKAFIVNGATYDAGTGTLKVSLTTTIQEAITGDYRIACVIVEDSVTGTASGYAQSNYYAGGSRGPMGGYELLPSKVPAAQMHYDHVARAITPNFAGYPNAFGTSAAANATFTHTFTYTIPSTWEADELHIVGLVIDPTGKIDNASSTTIATAVTTGYTAGTEVEVLGVNENTQVDAVVSLYPNPTTDQASILLNLEKESDVQVAVYSINGALIATKDYGKISGATNLPIETSLLTTGMYFVNVTIDGATTAMKLIKE